MANSRRDYQREHMRKWRAENPEKAQAAYRRDYMYKFRQSPEQKAKARERRRIWYSKNKERALEQNRSWRANNIDKRNISVTKSTYGLTQDQAVVLNEEKKHGCVVCGKLTGRMHIDHNHETGKVRGILCHGCNAALGFAADSSATLRRLAQYVDLDGMISKEERKI